MSEKTTVTSPIDTSAEIDTYPTHYANKGSGGLHIVNTDSERNAIPTDRRINGMHVYVRSTDELTPDMPHGYISIYNQGNDPPNDWVNYPIRKILRINDPQSEDFAKCKKGDQIISDDYLYICVETNFFKKIIMSL